MLDVNADNVTFLPNLTFGRHIADGSHHVQALTLQLRRHRDDLASLGHSSLPVPIGWNRL
jgi:hypothetical protein